MNLNEWAARHGVSNRAICELYEILGVVQPEPEPEAPKRAEDYVQSSARLMASALGLGIWRNNVGVAQDKDGRPVRYGLANDSKRINTVLKSSDLIGITPYTVQPYDVGRLLGIFTALECKASDWAYRGTDREKAQLNYINLVQSKGGIAGFITDARQLERLVL